MGPATYILGRRRSAAVAVVLLGLACCAHAAADPRVQPCHIGGDSTDCSQTTAAAASASTARVAGAVPRSGMRRLLQSTAAVDIKPGQQPDGNGKPQPCPPGSAKVAPSVQRPIILSLCEEILAAAVNAHASLVQLDVCGGTKVPYGGDQACRVKLYTVACAAARPLQRRDAARSCSARTS